MIFYTLTEELHRELLLIDSLGTDTLPDEFPDWEDFERRVFSVKACLESSLGIDLEVDRRRPKTVRRAHGTTVFFCIE